MDDTKTTVPAAKTDDEWQRELTPEQYRVLRCHGTERAGTSPLNDEHRAGTFYCAGCGEPLFGSGEKFDSGTGWPSFWAPIADEAVGTSTDRTLFLPRTEVHCSRCGGHLGHVFDDGPNPTGLRYCMNGAALRFQAKDEDRREAGGGGEKGRDEGRGTRESGRRSRDEGIGTRE